MIFQQLIIQVQDPYAGPASRFIKKRLLLYLDKS